MNTNIITQLGNFKSVGSLAPNQYQIYFENGAIFQSYNSIIVIIIKGEVYIGKNYDFSKTTGKWRNEFLGETLQETREKIKNGEYKMLNY